MSSYDIVKTRHSCVSCKKPVTRWQSKDGECVYANLTPADVDSYHGSCSHCGKYQKYQYIGDEFVLVGNVM